MVLKQDLVLWDVPEAEDPLASSYCKKALQKNSVYLRQYPRNGYVYK